MLSKNRIKYIQSLTRKKERDIHRRFIAETPKVVNEFLNSSYKAEFIFATAGWISENRERLSNAAEVLTLADDDLKKISQLKTPNSVVAVFEIPAAGNTIVPAGEITLALDDLQDPGNMGTIIRIADWFGIKNMLCSPHTVDAYNPKVVQASMGSLAHVKISYLNLAAYLSDTTTPVITTTPDGDSLYDADDIHDGILVIGNEGKGISPEVLSLASKNISIPRFGKAESLNAAVATAVILSHLVSKK